MGSRRPDGGGVTDWTGGGLCGLRNVERRLSCLLHLTDHYTSIHNLNPGFSPFYAQCQSQQRPPHVYTNVVVCQLGRAASSPLFRVPVQKAHTYESLLLLEKKIRMKFMSPVFGTVLQQSPPVNCRTSEFFPSRHFSMHAPPYLFYLLV